MPAALTRTTIDAMIQFAAGTPTAGAVSATALSWTLRTLRTMQMTRLAFISALLIAGLAATGAAMWTTPDQQTIETRSVAPSKVARKSEPTGPEKKVDRLSVRVVDTKGRGVPDVEVKVIEYDAAPAGDGPGYRTLSYRTGADGRFRLAVNARYERLTLEARPDDRTLGWASLPWDPWPKATDEHPLTLTLLARNHRVEGTIVDTRGRPIRGVQVRAVSFNHDDNGSMSDFPRDGGKSRLASAVTNEAGRYQLSLPEATSALIGAYHPRYVGPWLSCGPEDRTIAPVTLEDAGAIAGTVVDTATGRPVAGAQVGAQCIEITERILGGGGGRATSDAQGHFLVGGLAPGVYNLVFKSSPKGRRFTARAVEGVRVQAGREAHADLRMIEGRRLRGRAIFAVDGEPVANTYIMCYSASHPRSGAACQSTYTDEQGHFEHFLPPGPAFVYINNGAGSGSAAQKTLNVPADRDPDPVILKRGHDLNAKPAPPPRFIPPIECEVRVRVKTEPGDRPAPGADRV